MASLRTVPRLLQLRPLLQPGMLCPCHGQPLRPPPPPAPGGWLELGRWRCAGGGGGAPLEEAAGACTPDASLVQFGAHTLLRMPVPAMAAAARGFCRPLGLGEAVIVASEAVVPSEALDAQLLLGPALLVVPSAPPAQLAGNAAAEEDSGGGDGGDGVRGSGQAAGADANARRVRALCSSLRTRDAMLLCSCEADLDARRSLPVKQWCALQAGGEGAALLLWRLASAEQLLPPSDDDASAAGATPNQSTMVAARAEDEAEAEAHAEAAAEAEAAAALSLLDAARVGVPGLTRAASGAGLMPALPLGIAAWSQAILQVSTASYTQQPSAPAAQAAPGAANGGGPAAEGGGGGGVSAGEQEEGGGGKGPDAASGARPAGAGAHGLRAQEEGAVRGRAGQCGDAGGGGGDGAGQQHTRHTEGAVGGGQRRLRLASSSGRAGSGSKGGKSGKGGLSLSRIGA
ncbi:hypothetical protein MNEG_7665 [Monoraphidium neglectum]|uniref:Uncharacterized protein n=1 Tax=Monoraphidium neglectum TaxID=145388 RepID=A0A0D2N246_9CHLO|nr:hypothetical protein MNEG_7665 [Monoraphidium neglectum]KIZ00296.1 hypothetical protein MNEG_7665 [Monoraphidium neglectum]|eukprot:XP_013899315.1 hypothetical protein MNEG_7665 [Monoraphidium neglectum]